MNKFVQYALIACLAVNFLALPVLVFAEDEAPGTAPAGGTVQGLLDETAGTSGAGYNTSKDQGQTGLARIVGSVVRAFISLIGIIFVSYTVYGGFLWMTAAGNDEKISKAKNILRDGIIGIIVILAAGAIYITVRELLLSGTVAGTDQSR